MPRFEQGNKAASGGMRPGAGRKPREAHLLLKRILKDVSVEDYQEVLAGIVEYAKAGSIEHQKLLFYYTFGKPVETVKQQTEVKLPDTMRVEIVTASPEGQRE